MCLKASPQTVVFFSVPTTGMVVNSDHPDWPYGEIVSAIFPDDFEDAPEDLVVWLTEGPTEPIQEAIDMVERIKSLKPE